MERNLELFKESLAVLVPYLAIAKTYIVATYIKSLMILEWVYGYLRKGFYDWIDVSGVTHLNTNPPVKCVYYNYDGDRYLIPIPETRGPAPSFPELERYFLSEPETLTQLMGPFNDFHGRSNDLMKILKL